MHKMNTALRYISVIVITAFFGCGSYNGQKVRSEHAEGFRKELADKTEEILSSKEQLGLDDCIRIALANSFETKKAQINARIAKLQRKVAFANFLPTVDLNYQYTNFEPQIFRKFGAMEAPMSDKRVREVTWQIQMSVFNPATWFMYSMHTRGQEIADIAAEYTRQITVLQVTTGYYYCLSLEEYEHAVASRLKAAQALEKELAAFHEEGLVSNWQAGQARVLAMSSQVELDRTQRARQQAGAQLLAAMGLSPMGNISLKAQMLSEPPAGSLEDLISQALLCHPELQIADRRIAIEQEKVKTAVSQFLPVLVGFANRTDSSDSFLKYSNYWTTGLAGTLSVFNGFANINEYKAAKERNYAAFIQREQATAALMLEVIRANLNLSTAAEEMTLTQENLKVASEKLLEIEQKRQEGLVNSSELLEAVAAADNARTAEMNSRFQYEVATATLLNVMGKTKTDFEEPKHED